MAYNKDAQIKLFRFYDSDSFIGINERKKVEKEINDFLREYSSLILDIKLSGNIIMVVYRDAS